MKTVGRVLLGAFFFIIAFGFIGSGFRNHKLRKAYKNIQDTSIQALATNPPEKALLVRVKGDPLQNSLISDSDNEYIIFIEKATGFALYVRLSEESELRNVTVHETTLIEGLVRSFEKPASFSKIDIPQDIRVANLLILENSEPPGWFISWGFIIIGVFIFLLVFNSATGENE